MGKGACLGEEAVLADSGRAAEKIDFFNILLVLTLTGCAPSLSEPGGNPRGLSQRDVERD
jgi:hypothetical protein